MPDCPLRHAAGPRRRQWLLGAAAAGAWPRLALGGDTEAAPAPAAGVWRVGPPGVGLTLAQALARAGDGDIVEIEPGTYRGDVAVIAQRRLTLRGAGATPVLDAAGQHAQGKAILVVVDGDVTVDNLEFRGARVPHRNGAGIRHEGGRLRVRRCRFIDNQNGILTANQPDAELHLEDCLFAQAPHDASALHHLLYVGRIARLTMRGCRLQGGWGGHLVKSRARQSQIEYNLIVDGPQGRASYEVDLPDGGLARLVGNVIGQSAGTLNPVVVSFGAEGGHWPHHALHMAHNTLLSDGLTPAWFLRLWSERLGLETDVQVINNLTVGPGLLGPWTRGRYAGNRPALRAMFVDADAGDFRLPMGSLLRGAGVDPRAPPGPDLRPRAEFAWPLGSRPLEADPVRWTPGAYQR